MLTLSHPILPLLSEFRYLFDARTWVRVTILVVGAIMTPNQRTVTAVLRTMGLGSAPDFARYHEVLSRARWSPRKASRIMFRLLVNRFVGDGPVVLAIDETHERRSGPRIRKAGFFHDARLSSGGQVVKTRSLRWISMMFIGYVGWADRYWALPFLTVLAPPRKYNLERRKRHKTIPDWGLQMIKQARRWLPDADLIVVADGAYAVRKLLAACQRMLNPVTVIARLRVDAALFDSPPPRKPGQKGRPKIRGDRKSTARELSESESTEWTPVQMGGDGDKAEMYEMTSDTGLWAPDGKHAVEVRRVVIRRVEGNRDPVALLCTNPELSAERIVELFARLWQVEVTFQEVRRHLGVEAQRQWSDNAIDRTTPCLLGLFFFVALAADMLSEDRPIQPRKAAWYPKTVPTFADALALVRGDLTVPVLNSSMSQLSPDQRKMPP